MVKKVILVVMLCVFQIGLFAAVESQQGRIQHLLLLLHPAMAGSAHASGRKRNPFHYAGL